MLWMYWMDGSTRPKERSPTTLPTPSRRRQCFDAAVAPKLIRSEATVKPSRRVGRRWQTQRVYPNQRRPTPRAHVRAVPNSTMAGPRLHDHVPACSPLSQFRMNQGSNPELIPAPFQSTIIRLFDHWHGWKECQDVKRGDWHWTQASTPWPAIDWFALWYGASFCEIFCHQRAPVAAAASGRGRNRMCALLDPFRDAVQKERYVEGTPVEATSAKAAELGVNCTIAGRHRSHRSPLRGSLDWWHYASERQHWSRNGSLEEKEEWSTLIITESPNIKEQHVHNSIWVLVVMNMVETLRFLIVRVLMSAMPSVCGRCWHGRNVLCPIGSNVSCQGRTE